MGIRFSKCPVCSTEMEWFLECPVNCPNCDREISLGEHLDSEKELNDEYWNAEELEEITNDADAFVETWSIEDCRCSIISSRVCEKGTLGCNVRHEEEE